MINLRSIDESRRKIELSGHEPAVIILNEVDFLWLGEEMGWPIGTDCETVLGLKILRVPRHLRNNNFLKEGKALVLAEEYVDLLREDLK